MGDNDATAVSGRHGRFEAFHEEGFILQGNVAVWICGGATHHRHIRPYRLVPQHFASANLDDFHQVLTGACAFIQFAAFDAGIDKSSQAHLSNEAGASRGNFTKPLGDYALRQVVGFHFVIRDDLDHIVVQSRVAQDHALDHAGVGKVVHAPLLRTERADPGRPRHREAFGRPRGFIHPVKGGKDLFDGHGFQQYRGSIRNTFYRFICRQYTCHNVALPLLPFCRL
ncbi:MAG: hypothetical protein BWY09_02540 [Candidatus Hydrogenedentes bacterium ADurb.Bin179]|nr:MAG: hypothetical protein BWY09_02540 [Candidatus Hydrogenedentes bacterium ADurb.Bin179]